MGLFVKICGLAREQDVRNVTALKPDAIGFVFWPHSKRAVEPDVVAKWVAEVPADIKKVGVFVNASLEELRRAVETAGLDVVQFHGDEPAGLVDQVKAERWKVVHLDRTPREAVKTYHVDAFLVDSYSAEAPGGTGRVADWNQAANFVKEQTTPVLLAGGLAPDNVMDALQSVRPYGVDVSSGVESEPGKKDLERVRAFIEACRNF